ncbi:MAG: hypothetical protein VCD00_15005, partial [Candidatus Hydrogenedentota bacterium]
MHHKSNHILALQCSEHHISALRARTGKSGVTLTNHIVEEGNWPQEDGSLLRKLIEMTEAHGFADNRIVSIIPRHLVTVRVLELPATDPAEIEGMVALSAQEWVPFNADEIVVSSCIIKTIDDSHSQVLAVVVPQFTIDEHIQTLASAGLEPEHIYLSTACILAALEFPVPHGENALYFHRSGRNLETLALRESGIEFSRGSTCDDLSAEAIADAIRDNRALYERESGNPDPRHQHFSQSVDSKGLNWDAVAHKVETSIQDCPQGLRSVQKGVELLDDVPLPEIGALLIAQGDSSFVTDLLPGTVTQERERSSNKRNLIEYSAAMLLALILLIGVFGQAVQQRTTYLTKLDEQAALLRPEAQQVALKRRHLQRMQAQVTRVDPPLEQLARISLQAPETGLTISRFKYRYDEGITLNGRSTTPMVFAGLIDRLRTVGRSVYPQLVQARELYSHDGRERDRVITEFAISIEFPEERSEEHT